ncbi:hypothetical protein [Natrinema soli]|uniref:Uncharacterized protein n=1 Tax=Natrinema soli TaxID=1930624 RepID=A0ABD5SP89_9EURY|nr:hypothetical protein [Natrinema soli]
MPCTIVNIGIAAVLAVAAVVIAGTGIGILFFLVALAIIYLHGYLVPGTPTLTKRYLPASVLGLFGKESVTERRARSIDANATIEEQLVAIGVFTVKDNPALTDSFANAWKVANERFRFEDVDESALRTLFGTDDVSRHAATGAVVDGNQSIRWISESALVADVTASRLLAERGSGWETVEPNERIALLRGLRLFLRVCPACDGAVDVTERTADPCCERPHTLIEVTCSDCGTPLADDAVVGIDADASGRVRAIRR